MRAVSELRGLLTEVGGAGSCSHPVRLSGTRVDHATGEFAADSVTVACKDRRSAVCPACSAVYKADAWQLVAAGLRGGKGVPAEVVGHPRLFVTMTAPSFGPVHSRMRGRDSAPCHPRRKPETCRHGVALDCMARHRADDPVLGEPLCPNCFDYTGAVLWNAHASRLWRRTTVAVLRAVARNQGCSENALRDEARLSFVKVAEFQRRGLVHLHAVVRADGPSGPGDPAPGWLDAGAMQRAVAAAVRTTTMARVDGRGRLGWGRQLDIVELGHEKLGTTRLGDPYGRARLAGEPSSSQTLSNQTLRSGSAVDVEAIAAYVAKYATKTSDGTGQLARPLRSITELDRMELRPHPSELVRTAWRLGAVAALAELRLRAHAHTFGYPGHFTTKSRRYSTTFGALRQARSDHYRGTDKELADFDGGWHYVGRGYRHPDGERLARALFDASRRGHCSSAVDSPSSSPAIPHRSDQE